MDGSNGSFEQTPLWQDVLSVIQSGPKPVNFDTFIQIHTPDSDFNALKILEMSETCDYSSSFAGSLIIRFYLGLGDYIYKLYPHRNLLEVSIKRIPQQWTSGTDDNGSNSVIKYRAVLDLKNNPGLTGKRISDQDYETLNQSEMVEVTLQLIDRNIDVLRTATVVGDAYPSCTPEKLITGILAGESNKFLIDGQPAIASINMVKPDNTKAMGNPLIPSGIKLVDIPTYVQERLQGVYSTGLGTFYQRYGDQPAWFVYSLYNPKRFDEDVDRVVFFSVPEDRLSGIDVTYRKDGKILYIAVTGPSQYSDDSQVSDLNAGVGYRIPSSIGLMNKPAVVSDGVVTTDRARLNTEVGSRNRTDGLYYAEVTKPTSNPFRYYSRMAARTLAQLELYWENSRPDLIYPGMPCKYVFMDGGEYREIKGVILGKHSTEALMGTSVASNSYRTFTKLGICLEYYNQSPQLPKAESIGTF